MAFIINYFLLAILAKSMGSSFNFVKASLTYAVIMTGLMYLFATSPNVSNILIVGVIKFLVALPIFYLLDRYSDTIFIWLLIFGVGGTLLILL